MALSDMFSSIYGTDDVPDYETLKRRRELARALAMRDEKHAHPLVQGFATLGSGIGHLLGEMKLSAAEKKFMEKEEATPRIRGGVRETPPPAAAPAEPPAQPAPAQAPAQPPTAQPAPFITTPPGPQSAAPNPNVDVVAANDFNRIDAAAPPPGNPSLAWATEPAGFPQERFTAAFDPTDQPVETPVSSRGDRLPIGAPPSQQVAERFPNEVAPAQEEQNVFAERTPTEQSVREQVAPARNPAPLADPSRLDPRLAAAIDRHGGPYKDYLTQLAIKEAAGKLDVVSKTGAAGPFQFTKGAAKDFQLGNRFDADESVKAAVRYTDRSANQLADKGLPVTYSNFAVMHQQGHNGGMNLLTGRGVPPRNLAVNNVDPRSSPEAALNKVKAYYAYDESGPTQTAQPAAAPYRNAAVQPDPARSDLQQNVALDPQIMADQGAPPGGQPMQTAEAPDSEQGSREMIAAALAGQQRPQGVQLASSDPARLGGITMPRAEPMGSMPLMQSRQNPQPPAPPPPVPGTEVSPDMLNSGASFLPGGGGMDIPSMSGPPPDPMLDPFAIPFNGASAQPAAGVPADAGTPVDPATAPVLAGAVAPDLGAGAQPSAVPVAPDEPVEPAPSGAPVRMAQALTPGAASDAGPMMIGGGAGVPPSIAPQQQQQQPPPAQDIWRAPRPPVQDFGPAPPVPAIATAPTPSYEPAPIPEIVPPPKRLPDIQPNDVERALIKQSTSPYLSPGRQREAAAELQLEQAQRAREQAQQDAVYANQLQRHNESVTNRREYLEKLPRERLELFEKAAKAEIDKATLQNNPIARAKAVAEYTEIQQVKIPKGLAETREIEGKIAQQPDELRKKGADASAAETTAARLAREEAEERELRRKWGTGGPGGGPMPPEWIRKDIETSHGKANSAVQALQTSAELRKILTDNRIVTGFGANLQIDYNRARAVLGDKVGGKKASDSEVYQALIAPVVAYIIKETVGGSQVSDGDREFARAAAGADLSAQSATLRKLIEMRDRGAKENIEKHGTLLNVAVGRDGSSPGSSNWHQVKGVTMPTIPIPEQAVRVLRANGGTKAQRENFNFRYGFGEDVASRVLEQP